MNRDSTSRSPVQPLRERVRETTRAYILEAAEAAFAGGGFHGAKMEDIAARAGVSVGTLYNYFDDRKSLLGALLDNYGAELVGKLDETLSGKAPFDERLRSFLRVVVRHLDAHWQLFAILVEDELAHGRDHSGKSSHRPMLREVYFAAEKLVALGIRQGALRKEGAELYPALLTGVIRSAFTHQLYEKRGGLIEGRVDLLSRFFLEGAGARS